MAFIIYLLNLIVFGVWGIYAVFCEYENKDVSVQQFQFHTAYVCAIVFDVCLLFIIRHIISNSYTHPWRQLIIGILWIIRAGAIFTVLAINKDATQKGIFAAIVYHNWIFCSVSLVVLLLILGRNLASI